MKRYCFFLFGILSVISGKTQVNIKDSVIAAPFFDFSYAVQVPGADLAKRFGINNNVGFGFGYKTNKNLLLGINGTYFFGSKIKEDNVLDSISTVGGFIINRDGAPSSIRLSERGFAITASLGKILPYLHPPNPNSGFIVQMGTGFIQHKIRVDEFDNNTPQLSKEYKKGYDRLSNGLLVSEFIGYVFLSDNRFINFFGGFEFIQGFTKNRRYNFDLMREINSQRFDLQYGFRFGWIIPLYERTPPEYYSY